ncbi:nuclear transport factor 2 family protein [Nocardia sp. NBC_01329]|uniref:nuclear transport factor 2 family protein n=1 Tax=Nocardia sp. NBC_01329 TaxID=2903594 RepID=UPI002E103766|nr:nuclear transport factor 2 family protein [Nocardia sp. NBC_01329]
MTIARSDSMAAELEVRDFLGRCALCADEGHAEEYRNFYSEDVVWETTGTRQVGIAEVVAAAVERRRAGISGPGSHTRHVITTLTVTVDGSKAQALSYVQFYRDAHATPILELIIRYSDKLCRGDGGWKITHRRITPG